MTKTPIKWIEDTAEAAEEHLDCLVEEEVYFVSFDLFNMLLRALTPRDAPTTMVDKDKALTMSATYRSGPSSTIWPIYCIELYGLKIQLRGGYVGWHVQIWGLKVDEHELPAFVKGELLENRDDIPGYQPAPNPDSDLELGSNLKLYAVLWYICNTHAHTTPTEENDD